MRSNNGDLAAKSGLKGSFSAAREVSVVIPIYTTRLGEYEVFSLRRTFSVLRDYDIAVVAPQGLDLQPLDMLMKQGSYRVERFDDAYFRGREGYNRLMVSAAFYERFLPSEYVLICQTDVYVFSDKLSEWCRKGYDYIGAPWLPALGAYTSKNWLAVADWKLRAFFSRVSPFYFPMKLKLMVGNGGLSLRRTEKFRDLSLKYGSLAIGEMEKHPHNSKYYEDVFWSYHVNRLEADALRIPSYREAVGFSMDTHPDTAFEISGGRLPFGAHAFFKRRNMKFWKKHIDFIGH